MGKSKKASYNSNGLNINISYNVSSYPNMKLLYLQYCESINLLTVRIKELNETFNSLKLIVKDSAKDPDCIKIKERLVILLRWRIELKEVAHEIKEYYNPAHWRSAAYTMNMRIPQEAVWGPYTDDKDD